MSESFCYNEYEDALEYGFDVVSVVEQRSLASLTNSKIEKLPRRLETGVLLSITASTLLNCQSWTINLLCGRDHTSDIAFHFNPRLLQHYVARNARLKGQWGHEESLLQRKFEIKNGEEFTLKFYTTDKKFYVTYNEKHVCSFRFRVHPDSITHVEIFGLVDVYKIEMEKFLEYPIDRKDLHIVEEIDRPVMDNNRRNFELPLRCVLSNGIQEDCQLEIYGIPKILPQSFSISLRDEVHIWPSFTIALRIHANFGNNMLVRNAFIDNKWGMEERIGGFKFLPSSPFSLWIRRSARKYSIWINGKLQAEFAFRCDPNIVKAVFIQGDVYVNGVFVNAKPEKYFQGT